MWYFIKENYLSVKDISVESFEKHIVDGIASNKVLDSKSESSFHADTLQERFSALWDIETRENQRVMAGIVEEAFYKWKKTVIEAPTWLGKTFAYLIPAIHFSLKVQEQVFISTSTKALQDQIYYKDLLHLSTAFDNSFSYTK